MTKFHHIESAGGAQDTDRGYGAWLGEPQPGAKVAFLPLVVRPLIRAADADAAGLPLTTA